jgi:hypothetical protein
VAPASALHDDGRDAGGQPDADGEAGDDEQQQRGHDDDIAERAVEPGQGHAGEEQQEQQGQHGHRADDQDDDLQQRPRSGERGPHARSQARVLAGELGGDRPGAHRRDHREQRQQGDRGTIQAVVVQNEVETTSPSRTVIRQAPLEHDCCQFKIPPGTTRTAAMAIRVSSCCWWSSRAACRISPGRFG